MLGVSRRILSRFLILFVVFFSANSNLLFISVVGYPLWCKKPEKTQQLRIKKYEKTQQRETPNIRRYLQLKYSQK